MKRHFFAVMFLAGACLCLIKPEFCHGAPSESRLYGELRAAMQVRSYPQVISLTDSLLKSYPLTLHKESITLMKGEALYCLGRFDESLEVLTSFSGKNYVAAYWCGRCWFDKKEWTKAANYFQGAVTLMQLQKADDAAMLHSALLYGAQSLADSGRTQDAQTLLEYMLPQYHGSTGFQRGLVLLYSLYNTNDEFERILSLYAQTSESVEQLPVQTRDAIKMSCVKAYGALGRDPEAQWNLCLSLLDSSDSEMVLSALSYAYSLAEKSDVYDVSQVLEKAEPFLQSRSQWRSELWLRLGIEAAESEEFDMAVEYYNRALATADADQRGCIVLFIADCYRKQNLNAKYRDVLKENLLLESSYAVPITISLVQYYLDEGNTGDALSLTDRLWRLFTQYPDHVLSSQALFYHAWLCALQGDWKTVRLELAPVFDGPSADIMPEMKLLYGQSLMHTVSTVGHTAGSDSGSIPETASSDAAFKQAESLFNEAVAALDATENRTAARQNLAVLYLMQKKYSSGFTVSRTESRLGYIAGLNAVGTGNWQTAASLLGTDTAWGLYYTAYAEYLSGATVEAQGLFSRFCREYPSHAQCRTAWNYVALCAVQNNDRKTALQAAEKCYTLSVTETQKTESALLWAELYAADRQYDKAITLLQPLANARNQAAVQIRFSLADLYYAKGDAASAAGILLDTQTVYFEESVKEEALYRLAELYFRQGKYTEAAARFDSCRKNYPTGTYAQQALYYNALCLDRTGDRQSKESAVLLYTMVTQSTENSPYLFASWARLAVLNRELEAYALSLEAIEEAVRISPGEAAGLGLGDLKKQVQLLQNGEEEQIVALVSQYEANRNEKTEKGRSIGVILAQRYLAGASTRDLGVETLKKITAEIAESAGSLTDRTTAAEAWSMLGTWQRQELLLADSVNSYVTSASFWAGINIQKQEDALFNAIKSLDELGRKADCVQVLNKMKEIDQKNPRVEQAEKLLDTWIEY